MRPIVAFLHNRITKVREFVQLARLSEADGHLQQKLKQLLKLSKEKWDAACEHGKTAVQVPDFSFRYDFLHSFLQRLPAC